MGHSISPEERKAREARNEGGRAQLDDHQRRQRRLELNRSDLTALNAMLEVFPQPVFKTDGVEVTKVELHFTLNGSDYSIGYDEAGEPCIFHQYPATWQGVVPR